MENHGRNRQSIADIERTIDRLLSGHPTAEYNEDGVASVPIEALQDIFSSFYDETGYQLMDEESLNKLRVFNASYPELAVNTALLVDFVAQMTKPEEQHQEDDSGEDSEGRGRLIEREEGFGSDRSSSIDSIDTTTHPHSRPPSTGPGDTPRNTSVFDTSRRQRSTPLASYVAPTSWKPRPPHSRRKSDASNRSDSEPYSDSPSAFKRSTSRQSRRRSNPVSPSTSDMDSSFGLGSPPFQRSRPPSRSHSRTASYNNASSFSNRESPEESPDDSADHFFASSVNSLPMPTHDSDSESENEDEETAMGRILTRSTASSTVSMEQSERLEALERHERELTRRLQESERTYQGKMATYEDEIAMLETRIEELKDEVAQHLRDEKDLRSKERQNMTQIGALETEIAKVTKSLEQSRVTYSSLQKQYQEQCAASEKYRDDLRQREITIRTLREQVSQHENEASKWGKEAQAYEDRVGGLERDLEESLQVHATLDEQKQENMLLKETIDRMRFDLDEMRNSASNAANAGPTNSARNTLSKSLGAELLGKMKGSWDMDEPEDVEEGDSLGGATEVPDEDSEGEDVIQTIITRKKRRPGLAAIKSIETKEVCDQGTQYDLEFKDVDASVASIQTDPEPRVVTSFADIQTDPIPEPEPEPERIMVEMEIQTIEPEPELEPSLPVASSSKTLVGDDLPPAYSLTQEQIRESMVKHYHPGVELPLHTETSLTDEQKDQWKALKKSLGVDCLVVDNLVDQAPTTPRTPPPPPPPAQTKKGGKFYNIYNTYIYKNSATSVMTHTAMVVGLSVLVMSVVGPHLVPHYSVPGGPTYYDRAAWSSFNSMHAAGEGFAMGGDGTAAVWGLLGRVGDGAARIARGWPT